MATTGSNYTILTVCTGNICRSPAMERLLASAFDSEAGVSVHSGGTHAHDGEDMQPPMKERVENYGADAGDFVARQVTAQMVEESDLILTATRIHLNDITAEVPEAAERSFTIREFGRLLQAVDVSQVKELAGEDSSVADQLAALAPLVAKEREAARSASREDDVIDPYMLPDDIYDESFRQISEPIETLLRLLGRD